MSKTFVIIMLSLLAGVMGCVPNRAYRTGGAGQRPSIQRDVPLATPVEQESKPEIPANGPSETSPTGDGKPNGQTYDLAFIEFDDMGEFWTIGNLRKESNVPENSQLAAAVDLIKMRKQDKAHPVFVITFIHGWKNNASENNEKKKNLAGFEHTLQTMAQQYPSRRFIGVFIAWRGQVVVADSFLSYWNRRDTANRIAGPSMTEALFSLMFTTHPESALEDPCATKALPDDNSQFVLIGHSFGGRILEHAVIQPYMTMLMERAARQRAGCETETSATCCRPVKAYGFRPPADLIILLNPAVDSLEGKAMIEGMMRLNIKAETELLDAVTKTTKTIPRPLFFSISSQRDLATRRLMPMAQWVTLAGKSSTRKNYGDDASSRGQASQRKQSYYFDNSEANVPEMRTHTICLVPTGERSRKELEKDKADDCSPSEGRYPFTVGKNSYFMKPQSGAWNTTPFWVVHPPGSLIRNHWDIFNSDVTGFLKWIIQTYGMGQTRIVIQ